MWELQSIEIPRESSDKRQIISSDYTTVYTDFHYHATWSMTVCPRRRDGAMGWKISTICLAVLTVYQRVADGQTELLCRYYCASHSQINQSAIKKYSPNYVHGRSVVEIGCVKTCLLSSARVYYVNNRLVLIKTTLCVYLCTIIRSRVTIDALPRVIWRRV